MPAFLGSILGYLFNLYPPVFQRFGWAVLAVCLLLLVFSLGLSMRVRTRGKKKDGLERKFLNKLTHWGYGAGWGGLLLWFVRYEQIPWLSMRFVLWAWIAFSAAWLMLVVRYKFVIIPKRRVEIARQTGASK